MKNISFLPEKKNSVLGGECFYIFEQACFRYDKTAFDSEIIGIINFI